MQKWMVYLNNKWSVCIDTYTETDIVYNLKCIDGH